MQADITTALTEPLTTIMSILPKEVVDPGLAPYTKPTLTEPIKEQPEGTREKLPPREE